MAENSSEVAASAVSDTAWECLQGAYDLQVHVAPDVIERRIDDVDLAKEFLSKGLSGFVLKSHYFPTAERAQVVCRAVPGIKAYGAITLNHSIGGLNPSPSNSPDAPDARSSGCPRSTPQTKLLAASMAPQPSCPSGRKSNANLPPPESRRHPLLFLTQRVLSPSRLGAASNSSPGTT